MKTITEIQEFVELTSDTLDSLGNFSLPALCMIMEYRAKAEGYNILDFYEKLKNVAKDVVDTFGEF